jgi:hypothetical protein
MGMTVTDAKEMIDSMYKSRNFGDNSLSEWEQNFIDSIDGITKYPTLTEKQTAKLQSIFDRVIMGKKTYKSEYKKPVEPEIPILDDDLPF